MITDTHCEQLIGNCLHQFIINERRKYGQNSNSVPIWFTCDMPWPILKPSLRCFNNESLEEYITRSYKIATGQALSSDLRANTSKLFVHFCLSYSIHTSWRCLKKYFTGSKNKLLTHSSSVLANSENSQNLDPTFIVYLQYYFLYTKVTVLKYIFNI